jgi:hypothetical protein
LDETVLLRHLEELAYALDVKVRHEAFEEDLSASAGGLCRIGQKAVFIMNAKASTSEKVQTLARALRRFDLSGIYIRPLLREFLEDGRKADDSSR